MPHLYFNYYLINIFALITSITLFIPLLFSLLISLYHTQNY